MIKQFLTVFGYILLYMFIWAALLLIPALAIDQTSESWPIITLLVMVALIFLLFLPFLNWVMQRTFHFSGEGQPVTAAELRHALLAINEFDAPVMAEERGQRIVFTWRYVDAKWWQILAKAGLQKTYECHVKLDDGRETAVLTDVTKSISWRGGPDGVKVGFFGFRGIEFSYEVGKAWGIRENFSPGKIYDYKFSTQEIKNPVLNTILRHGWDVRFGLW